MKTRKFVSILTLVLAVLIIAGSCATQKRIVKDSEEFYGIWINEEYKGSTPPLKKNVFNPDGTWEYFRKEASPWETDIEILEGGWIRDFFGTYTIEDKWTDSDGNVWYKVDLLFGIKKEYTNTYYLLMRISDSNKIMEYMEDRIRYGEKIEPKSTKYRIYYRQE